VPIGEVQDVQQWRKAARRAGRLLGRAMRTGVTANSVCARLLRPVVPGEQAEGPEMVAALIFNSDRQPR